MGKQPPITACCCPRLVCIAHLVDCCKTLTHPTHLILRRMEQMGSTRQKGHMRRHLQARGDR